jgi:hypothetical protein
MTVSMSRSRSTICVVTVSINPDIVTASSRMPWGRGAISAASGASSGVQHPAETPMRTAPLQPPATPPTPTTPPIRPTKQIRFTLHSDDDAMQPTPTTPPSATNTEDVAMQPVQVTPPSRSTATPTEDVTMRNHNQQHHQRKTVGFKTLTQDQHHTESPTHYGCQHLRRRQCRNNRNYQIPRHRPRHGCQCH